MSPISLRKLVAAAERERPSLDLVTPIQTKLFGPGTLYGDLARARAKSEAALERLARRLPWMPCDPAAITALRARAEEVGLEPASVEARKVGIFLALTRESEPQAIRLGQGWITDDQGHRATILPRTLPLDVYWRWLRKEAINAMEAFLVGEAYPAAPPPPRRGKCKFGWEECLCSEGEPDPEERLLQADRKGELCHALAEVAESDLLPWAEAELLVRLDEADGKPNLAEVARQLGKEPGTVRVQMMTIRRKLAALRAMS